MQSTVTTESMNTSIDSKNISIYTVDSIKIVMGYITIYG